MKGCYNCICDMGHKERGVNEPILKVVTIEKRKFVTTRKLVRLQYVFGLFRPNS